MHLAPTVAACGVRVPMISGRELGHSGGTLDKLESIPGFTTGLSTEEFRTVLRRTGLSLIGQTETLVPADKLLYALRDVTATVESIPLIAASIMSKKLAEGIDGLVLDVKVGSGAFMKTRESAAQLSRHPGGDWSSGGQEGDGVLTDMDQPLGRYVGNAAEVNESLAVLRGEASRSDGAKPRARRRDAAPGRDWRDSEADLWPASTKPCRRRALARLQRCAAMQGR